MNGKVCGRYVRAALAWTVFTVFPAFAQDTDTHVYFPPGYGAMLPPSAGGIYTDPVFGTSIRRVSDALKQPDADRGGNLVFITDEYSTMSPFNMDNSRLLALCESYFALYDGQGKFIRNLPLEIASSSEPRWSRKSPDVLYFVRGNQLKQYNTATGAMTVVHTFTQYASVNGKGESDICFDGDHFVLVGDNRYVFVFEISSDRQGPVLDAAGRAFDSVYVTPDDNVTVTWLQPGSNRYQGIELFDRNMSFLRQVSRAGGHMDVTRDTNGDEVLILTNSADPAPTCDNAIVKIRLADGRQTCLLSLDWSLAVHISAPDGDGWCFVETYAPGDPTASSAWKPYTNEILQVKLDGSEVRRLVQHRSRPFNSYNYQPHVSTSRDGTMLVYNSNFSLQSISKYPAEYADMYLLAVPCSGSCGNTSASGAGGTMPSEKTTVFQETDPAVAYSGPWFVHANASHDGGAARLAMDAGARATLTFSGNSVTWTGHQDEWSGIANVYVDGALSATVDTYGHPEKYRSALFSISGLAEGSHTLIIEATGTRGPLSSGAWVWIDTLVVTAADGSATTATANATSGSDSAVPGSSTWYIKSPTAGTASIAMNRTAAGAGTAVAAVTASRDPWGKSTTTDSNTGRTVSPPRVVTVRDVDKAAER